MVMCFEKIEGAKNPANMLTKCVEVVQNLNWYGAVKIFMII